jgi:hypothetical protein
MKSTKSTYEGDAPYKELVALLNKNTKLPELSLNTSNG